MNSLQFMLNNQILTMFNTGNVAIDMLIGMTLCSLMTTLITLVKFNDIFKFITKFYNKLRSNKEKKMITFSCKKDYGYPDTFKAILYYINKCPNDHLSHLKFITDTKYNSKSDMDEDENFFVIDEDKEIKIADNYYVCFSTFDENQKMRDGTQKTIVNFELDVYTYNKSLENLKEFIQTITEQYEKYIMEKSIKNQYFIECNYDSKKDRIRYEKYIFSTNRSYQNIFFDQKKEVLSKIQFFLNNKEWYNTRGIPYTLGLLFYGDPGCGKTSLIKAIMKETKRHAISINLSNDFDLDKLKKLMLDESVADLMIPQENRIFILEDIDAMGDIVKDRDLIEQEKTHKIKSNDGETTDKTSMVLAEALKVSEKNKNNLSCLLNIIDGIIECPGRIIIMTTNKEKTLDKALIRPGRIDMKVNFTKCSKVMAQNLLELFYEKKIPLSKLSTFKENSLTPAEVMELCFSNPEINDVVDKLNVIE